MYDALVVGAGPAGSTAARLLAKAGWSVAVVEKSGFPRRKVCGEFISATSLPLLYHPAIRQGFLAQAGPEVRRVGIFAADIAVSSAMPPATDSLSGWGRAIGREHLDFFLAQAAAQAGAKFWQPWKMTALRRAADGWICTVAADDKIRELSARIVIAANGSWERNALSAVQDRASRPSDLFAFKAHFRGSALPEDLMPLLAFPGGYGGMVHTDDGRVSLSCCIRRDVLQRRRREYGQSAAEAALQHIIVSCEGVRGALAGAHLEGRWLSAGPIRPGIRRRYAPGIFFAGNIAGEAHPIVAEGISMAMQSAWLLCRPLTETKEKVFAPHILDDIGRAYSRDWQRSFMTRIRVASAFAHLAMRPEAAYAAPLLQRFPVLLRWSAQLSGKTKQIVQPVEDKMPGSPR